MKPRLIKGALAASGLCIGLLGGVPVAQANPPQPPGTACQAFLTENPLKFPEAHGACASFVAQGGDLSRPDAAILIVRKAGENPIEY